MIWPFTYSGIVVNGGSSPDGTGTDDVVSSSYWPFRNLLCSRRRMTMKDRRNIISGPVQSSCHLIIAGTRSNPMTNVLGDIIFEGGFARSLVLLLVLLFIVCIVGFVRRLLLQ